MHLLYVVWGEYRENCMKNIFSCVVYLKKQAFSLLEIMMALVVVSIMLAILAPAFTVKNPSSSSGSINVIDTTPVGVIAAWYGTNYPKGWLPADGRPISAPEYAALRDALGGRDILPDLNRNKDPENSMSWIIKARRN